MKLVRRTIPPRIDFDIFIFTLWTTIICRVPRWLHPYRFFIIIPTTRANRSLFFTVFIYPPIGIIFKNKGFFCL